MAEILVIDDAPDICKLIAQIASRTGHTADSAQTLEEGMHKAAAGEYAVVFLDVWLPDGDGLTAVTRLAGAPSSPEIVVITGKGDPQGAESALTQGAFDYLQKPFALEDVKTCLLRALEYREFQGFRQTVARLKREAIVGESRQIRQCLHDVAEAAAGEHNVLICGETGTGKELFARALHENSLRASGPFVPIDCASLKSSLIESALFGHVKGAFTGAVAHREGLIAQAHGGTLFLDEIGELPLKMQKTLLRVIQEKVYRPVGGATEVSSDFRLIAATNKELSEKVAAGRFRKDLFYRIGAQVLRVPPLREHTKDIPDIVHHHVRLICSQLNVEPKTIYPEVMDLLIAYEWPGNVRELVNCLSQCISKAYFEPVVHRKHLPVHVRVAVIQGSMSSKQTAAPPSAPEVQPGLSGTQVMSWKEWREHGLRILEQQYFKRLCEVTDKDAKEIAAMSGLSLARVYDLLKKHGL